MRIGVVVLVPVRSVAVVKLDAAVAVRSRCTAPKSSQSSVSGFWTETELRSVAAFFFHTGANFIDTEPPLAWCRFGASLYSQLSFVAVDETECAVRSSVCPPSNEPHSAEEALFLFLPLAQG